MTWNPYTDPSYIGPDPEWRREQAGEVIREGTSPPRVDAELLEWWADFLGRRAVPHRPPSSTEGGTGHALPNHGRPDLLRGDDSEWILCADPGQPSQYDPFHITWTRKPGRPK